MSKILRFLIIPLAAICLIGIITLVIGWLLGWNSATQFSNGFFWAGAILIVFGILSVIGGYQMRSNFSVLYSQSAGDMNTLERSKRWLADTTQGYGLFFLLFVSGALLLGLAVLIPNIF